jgi:flagellar biogenesis protein FliO
MFRLLAYAALGLLTASGFVGGSHGAPPAAASGPPDWQDNHSVYLAVPHDRPLGIDTTVPKTAGEHEAGFPPPASGPLRSVHVQDQAVQQAQYSAEVDTIAGTDPRQLTPPSRDVSSTGSLPVAQNGGAPGGSQRSADFGLPRSALYTMLSALAIVVGMFLTCAWLLRRGAHTAAAALPADVVSVLGRAPLAARQVAHLLRVGNKLVLVSLSPGGAETITEVTDPVEVDRLVGLCQQMDPHSTTKAFEQVFQQLSRETSPRGFLGNETTLPPLSSALDKIRPLRGEAARA